MSMITRCPDCSTMFKVVADQLRISEGWVRCGQCGQVFDGQANLQTPVPEETPTDASGFASTQTFADEPGEEPEPARREITPQELAEYMHAPTEPAPAVTTTAKLAATYAREPDFEDSDDWEPELDTPRSDTATPEPQAALAGAPQAVAAPIAAAPPPAPAAKPAATTPRAAGPVARATKPDVSFLRSNPGAAAPSRRATRWLLGLLALVLLLALLLQAAVFERHRLAATWPVLKPWLQSLCTPWACRVEPFKHIDSITVENSSFSRVRGDVYRLQVGLRNTGTIEVAMPALELTLTDVRDEAVLRRVLQPSELATAGPSLAAGAEWSGTLNLNVSASAAAGRVAGYRVLAFYP